MLLGVVSSLSGINTSFLMKSNSISSSKEKGEEEYDNVEGDVDNDAFTTCDFRIFESSISLKS